MATLDLKAILAAKKAAKALLEAQAPAVVASVAPAEPEQAVLEQAVAPITTNGHDVLKEPTALETVLKDEEAPEPKVPRVFVDSDSDFPAEAYEVAPPLTFQERMALSKAKLGIVTPAEPVKIKTIAEQQQADKDKAYQAYQKQEEEIRRKKVEEVLLKTSNLKDKEVVPALQAEIKTTVAKLSFSEMQEMRKQGQKAAKEAVEEMELMSEPPEELDASIVGEVEPVAIAKIYKEETKGFNGIEDLDESTDLNEAEHNESKTDTFSLNITLNARQLAAKEMALNGKCFALIGAAGTGKTTTQRSVAETLVQDSRLKSTSYKVVGGAPGSRVTAPSIAFVAYTRRASANLARAIHKSPELAETLAHNIMTIHALLEFEPEVFWNDEKQKEDFRFIPRRDAMNPLTITHLVIEEASMLGLDLWENLLDALPRGVQIIFIGDINQLPPVFGASILNYALVQLPIIELTEVYRNAGIVLANAHNVLKGLPLIEGTSNDEKTGEITGVVTIVRGKSPVQVGQSKTSMQLGMMFRKWYEMGYYDPEDCMILSPWNKKDLGTDNMNSWVAQFLGEKRKAVVWEIISGFQKLYLAVGDKVMYNKQDAVITEIKFNGMYHGKEPQPHGTDLGRFGVRILGAEHIQQDEKEEEDPLLTYTNFSPEELEGVELERKQQCSHVVTIQTETGQILSLSAAGDFSPQIFSLGYVLTVHKAQGCEWKKVFIILHKDHAVSLTRELFYTALTRARLECVVIAKDAVIEKAIKTQRIKGNSLADKIEFFNSGAFDKKEDVVCVK